MGRFSFQQMDLDAKVTRWDLREAADLAAVRKIARHLLQAMAGQELAGELADQQMVGDDDTLKSSRNFSVVVRDEAGECVFEARRSLPLRRAPDHPV